MLYLQHIGEREGRVRGEAKGEGERVKVRMRGRE